MKICFYLHNKEISGVDCSDPLRGNPGIGGTEYCILLTAHACSEFCPQNQIVLITSAEGKLPPACETMICPELLEVPMAAKRAKADLLIVSSLHNGRPLPAAFFARLDEAKIRAITWGHNFYLSDYCDLLAACPYVKANVFVGRQQYDRYIDHKLIRKSTCICNMYPSKGKPRRAGTQRPVVAYIGSLVPAKGFHVVAAAWKSILKQVPDAQLLVMGSGRLYSRNAALGPFGLAEEAYERRFMQGLTDEQGRLLPSVRFLGVLGAEKDEVIAETSVGVVNPTGRTETFGLSALDFESVGVPVVTIAKGGFLDTVADGETGILIARPARLAAAVTALLKDTKRNQRLGQAGIELACRFEPETIVREWEALFQTVLENRLPGYREPDSFLHTNLKWLRKISRRLHNPFPVIRIETCIRKALRRFCP